MIKKITNSKKTVKKTVKNTKNSKIVSKNSIIDSYY